LLLLLLMMMIVRLALTTPTPLMSTHLLQGIAASQGL